MTAAAALLARAEAAGLALSIEGDRLGLRGLQPELGLLHDLAGAKVELLALLAEREADDLYRKHDRMVAGLLEGFHRHHRIKR